MTFTGLAIAYFSFMKNAVVLRTCTYLLGILVLCDNRTGVACGKLFNLVAEFAASEVEPPVIYVNTTKMYKYMSVKTLKKMIVCCA